MAGNDKTTSEGLVALTLFVVVGALGLSIGGAAVKDFARARDSRSWPAIEGVVLSKNSTDSNDIRYAYVAGGHGHESRRVRFLTGLLREAPTDHLRPGESVTVYVDPGAPDVAVLKQGGSGGVFGAAAALAGALVFLGLGGVVRTLMNMTRRPVAVPAPLPSSAE
ncbi:MAG: DUF3592 domain-containing protein [Parvularculaceae bacterium]